MFLKTVKKMREHYKRRPTPVMFELPRVHHERFHYWLETLRILSHGF